MKRTILMLEHDDDDRYITREIFAHGKYGVDIVFVNNTLELTEHLLKCEQQQLSFPSLILMSYYSQPQDAVSMLEELKANVRYRHIPVVVLCGNANNEMISRCYMAGASSFIQKPVGYAESMAGIENFVRYWFDTVELP